MSKLTIEDFKNSPDWNQIEHFNKELRGLDFSEIKDAWENTNCRKPIPDTILIFISHGQDLVNTLIGISEFYDGIAFFDRPVEEIFRQTSYIIIIMALINRAILGLKDYYSPTHKLDIELEDFLNIYIKLTSKKTDECLPIAMTLYYKGVMTRRI